MCAGSTAKIKDKNVSVYMGYYGGNIKIGDFEYKDDGSLKTRAELIELLSKFRKIELATLIADLIDNADE